MKHWIAIRWKQIEYLSSQKKKINEKYLILSNSNNEMKKSITTTQQPHVKNCYSTPIPQFSRNVFHSLYFLQIQQQSNRGCLKLRLLGSAKEYTELIKFFKLLVGCLELMILLLTLWVHSKYYIVVYRTCLVCSFFIIFLSFSLLLVLFLFCFFIKFS